MSRIGRGVKKVNESILQDGRTIIITELDNDKLDWDRIPDGTLKVNPITGELFVKLVGEGDWIPVGLDHKGNLTIAKDAKIVYETFFIVNPDNGNGTFTYKNEEGEYRTKPLTEDGKQAFELEKGSYIVNRNKIEVFINDALHRSKSSGGLIEIDETRVALEEKKQAGTKVTFKYFLKVNIGNPYPRFFINENEPEAADWGDFWLDISLGMSVLKWWNGKEWKALSKEGLEDILGGNVIYKGFNVVPGSGRSVTINHGPDGFGSLFINGVKYKEENIISNIPIDANTSGSNRIDTLYAKPASNKLTYHIAKGTTKAPDGTAKLAEITVPNNASSISASNITLARKAFTIHVISEDLHDATNLPNANTLARRDASGRLRANTPVHAQDVARKQEIDELDNKKVNRSGDTMTGQLTIENSGVFPKMNAVAASVSGANYKEGITTFNTGTLSGYPTQNGIAVNIKINSSTVTQWIYDSGSDKPRAWFRHWHSSTGWTAFKEVRDLGETADTAYRGDRGKIAYDHAQIKNANPHETRHDQLLDIQGLDPTSTNTTKNKHVSNAQAKKWEDHVNLTSNANPHGTRHRDLREIEGADVYSTDQTQNKHVSNAQAKKWEDHTSAESPHSKHVISHNYANQRIFVQSTKPTSGMKAGDIWIDTSTSYGTK